MYEGRALSIIIPTAGRETLARTLESVLPQLVDDDEVIVCGDTTDGPLDFTESLCNAAGFQVRYAPFTPGHHDWGHSQVQHGMGWALGDYFSFCDDDDVYTPGALRFIREQIVLGGTRPYLFRFRANFGRVVWQREGVIAPGMVGGHCLVTPTRGPLGAWGSEYEGDFRFVRETLDGWAKVGVEPEWVNGLIAIQRPS